MNNDNKIDELLSYVTSSKKLRKALKYLLFGSVVQFAIFLIIMYYLVNFIFSEHNRSINSANLTFKALNSKILTPQETHRILGALNTRIVKYVGDTTKGKYDVSRCERNLFLSDNIGLTYRDGKNILFITDKLLDDEYLCKVVNKQNQNRLTVDWDNLEYSAKYISLQPSIDLPNHKSISDKRKILSQKNNIVLNNGTILVPLAVINTNKRLYSKEEAIPYIQHHQYKYTPQNKLMENNFISYSNYYFTNIKNAKTNEMAITGKFKDKFADELSTFVKIGNTSRLRLDPKGYTNGVVEPIKYPKGVYMSNKVW